jgi:CBS domain-containing protein
MKTVNDLLNAKGREIYAIAPDAPVFDAIKLMAEHSIGAVLVMDGDRLAGILSERDYARKVILQSRSSKDTPIRTIMTPKVVCAEGGHTIEQCMAMMTERKIRHLPVLENDRVVGVVSIGDLVKARVTQQEHVIEELERYVSG